MKREDVLTREDIARMHEAEMVAQFAQSDVGALILRRLEDQERLDLAEYDASPDHETTLKIQGRRERTKDLIEWIQGASVALANLRKEQDQWLRKTLRQARKVFRR